MISMLFNMGTDRTMAAAISLTPTNCAPTAKASLLNTSVLPSWTTYLFLPGVMFS